LCINSAEGNRQVVFRDEFTIAASESPQSVFEGWSAAANLTETLFDFGNDRFLVFHTDTMGAGHNFESLIVGGAFDQAHEIRVADHRFVVFVSENRQETHHVRRLKAAYGVENSIDEVITGAASAV